MAAASYYAAAAGRAGKRSSGGAGLRRKCMAVAKQQKTRFYILGRCITMLLCWHAHAISD